jgi:hypothetical protein
MNHFNKSGFGDNIYCVLCGRMTPDQKNVRERSKVNTQLFIDVMTWFVLCNNLAIPASRTFPFIKNAFNHC